ASGCMRSRPATRDEEFLRKSRLAPLGGARFGTAFFAPLLDASDAFAADRLDEAVEVILAVVVGDFIAGPDIADCSDDDHAALAGARPWSADHIRLGIGPAGMVGLARPVASR